MDQVLKKWGVTFWKSCTNIWKRIRKNKKIWYFSFILIDHSSFYTAKIIYIALNYRYDEFYFSNVDCELELGSLWNLENCLVSRVDIHFCKNICIYVVKYRYRAAFHWRSHNIFNKASLHLTWHGNHLVIVSTKVTRDRQALILGDGQIGKALLIRSPNQRSPSVCRDIPHVVVGTHVCCELGCRYREYVWVS